MTMDQHIALLPVILNKISPDIEEFGQVETGNVIRREYQMFGWGGLLLVAKVQIGSGVLVPSATVNTALIECFLSVSIDRAASRLPMQIAPGSSELPSWTQLSFSEAKQAIIFWLKQDCPNINYFRQHDRSGFIISIGRRDRMDIVYHGNCLDGVFCAFSMFVFLNLLKHKFKDQYKDKLSALIQKQIKSEPIPFQQLLIEQNHPLTEKKEEFYLYDKENKMCSVVPGKFNKGVISYVKGSYKNKYICLVDCYGQSVENIDHLCNLYDHVYIIDHHVSALDVFKNIERKNLTIVFDQSVCAFELVNRFLDKNFSFSKICPTEFNQWLRIFEKYIHKNDLKLGENAESKQFILGYYHFNIQMLDSNFQLFKTLSNLSIPYILDKGKKIYPSHMARLIELSQNPSLITLKYKNKTVRMLGIRTSEVEYISDLGVILSMTSSKQGMDNASMFYKTNMDQVRISFRSHRDLADPKALQMASMFGGGGHTCAAGCRVSKTMFSKYFNITSKYQAKSIGNIDQLLFHDN